MDDTGLTFLKNEVRFLTVSIERYQRVLELQKAKLIEVTEQMANYAPGRCGIMDQHHGPFCDQPFGHSGLHTAVRDGMKYEFSG